MDGCKDLKVRLSGLPVEVVEQVLSWVHPRAAMKLRLLSRSFYACLSSRSFWVKNFLRFPPKLFMGILNACDFLFFPVGYQEALASRVGDKVTKINWFGLQEGKTANIPNCINQFSLLQSLSICGVKMLGGIPKEIGDLTNLKGLFLGSNHLTGEIPDSLGCLLNCKILNLADNSLTGMIPGSLGNLLKLKDLILYSNLLTGPISPALGSLKSLENLFLSNNFLTGPIPESLASLGRLGNLWLDKNRLTGTIPESFSQMRHLNTFVFDKTPELILSPVLEAGLRANGVVDRFANFIIS